MNTPNCAPADYFDFTSASINELCRIRAQLQGALALLNDDAEVIIYAQTLVRIADEMIKEFVTRLDRNAYAYVLKDEVDGGGEHVAR
ncbi:MAG: hypothetical protein Q7J47_17630 [Azoarcus sp.]|nr:hypothetical protein [Azoarcus sp.]